MKIAIIGGGAAGFFSAIAAKESHPEADVVIFEKTQNLLAKVKISGGGRCNVTNGCTAINELCAAYPRGGKELKKAFHIFNTRHTKDWFQSRGVPLIIQDDNCVFPVSQSSQSIIDCLLSEAKRHSVKIQLGMNLKSINPVNGQLALYFNDALKPVLFNKVIVTTGGSPKRSGLEWLEKLGHKIVNPVPSLFTFKMSAEPVTQLMGIVVEKATVGIQGTKFNASGPLLITHWGMSGPAILKVSSYAARLLNEAGYNFKVQVNWANERNSDSVLEYLRNIAKEHPNKQLSNLRPYNLPARLWMFLLTKIELSPDKSWVEPGKKGLNQMANVLTNDEYTVNGRTTFKEEFVTCGGVSLESINMSTMQSNVCPNLYFAGEIMDIDAITGGFNLQCAWTTGFIAGKLNH
jgi:predicted Rossmann fold flavoprotein